MPVKITAENEIWISPTTQWQYIELNRPRQSISLNRNFYLSLIKVK